MSRSGSESEYESEENVVTSGVASAIFGGWQINGVYYLTSGQPFTPQNGLATALNSNYLTAGDRPFAGNPNAPKGSVAISQVDAFLSFGNPDLGVA